MAGKPHTIPRTADVIMMLMRAMPAGAWLSGFGIRERVRQRNHPATDETVRRALRALVDAGRLERMNIGITTATRFRIPPKGKS